MSCGHRGRGRPRKLAFHLGRGDLVQEEGGGLSNPTLRGGRRLVHSGIVTTRTDIMRCSLTSLLLASTAAAKVVEIDLNRNAPGTRHWPLSRRFTHTETLANNISGGGYYAEIEVGTPPQSVSMVLDTGSSDAWMVSTEADLCRMEELQAHYKDSCWCTCKIFLSPNADPRLILMRLR